MYDYRRQDYTGAPGWTADNANAANDQTRNEQTFQALLALAQELLEKLTGNVSPTAQPEQAGDQSGQGGGSGSEGGSSQAGGASPAATTRKAVAPSGSAATASGSGAASSAGGNAANNWGIAGKAGLGISPTSANGNGANMGDASWYSNWSLNPTQGAQGKFVPTVQKLSDASSQSALESAFKASGSKLAFGFNEPDNAGQANISPSQAASAWGNVAGAAQNTGTELTSPSVTNSGQSGQGLDWLKQFMNSDTTVNGKTEKVGDTVSAINLHWYGSAGNPNDPGQIGQQVSDLKSYLQKAHAEFPDKPIVLSEVGLNADGNSASASPEFKRQLQQMLSSSDMDFVQLYAPYGS